MSAADTLFLGNDLLAWLLLALGGAMLVGNGLALARPPERPKKGDLRQAPVGRSLTMMAVSNLARTYTLQGDTARALEYQARVDRILEKNIDLNLAIGSEREKLAYLDSISERTARTVSLNARSAPACARCSRPPA